MDIERIRAETPGLKNGIHLMAAGSALMPEPVLSAVLDHLRLEAEIGGYEAEARQSDMLSRVYGTIARLINASAPEIAVLEHATAAWCQAFYALDLKPGDRILTCEAEYAANFVALLHRQNRDGIVIDVVPSDTAGQLDVAALEERIGDDVKLIALTWIPTNGGLVNPAEAVGEIASRHNIPYLLDACQAVGQMPVDVQKLKCDFLSATARKFLRGPRGVGFLYVRQKWLEKLHPPMIDLFAATWTGRTHYSLRSDARRFETWENAYALRAGLVAAVDYALDLGLDPIRTRALNLAADLRERLERLPGAQVKDAGDIHCAIVSFSIDGIDQPREVVAALRQQGIAIGASDPSSTRIDAENRGLGTVFRASPHYYNTEEEIDGLIRALRAFC